MDYREADRQGRFRWRVSPATNLWEPSWGPPALCIRGIRSNRLACASFDIASDGGLTTPAPVITPAPSTALPSNCRDVGFTILCTR